LTEAQLEKISDERPLPIRMKTVYAQQITDMNTMANEGRKAAIAKEEALLREQAMIREQSSQAPVAASAMPAFSFQQENEVQASFHPIPSVIYTPSPNPLPQVVRTSPQQQPNVEGYQRVGGTQQQQGTVFTQSHLPLSSGVIPNQAQVNLPSLQQQFLQPQASSQPQTLQDLAAQIQMQAQIQLLANALAAAQQGQSYQPPQGLPQPNVVYQQPQQYTSYPAPTFPQVNGLPQQDQANQPMQQQGVGIVSGPNSLGSIPTLNDILTLQMPTAQRIANYALQQQQQQQQQQQPQQQPQQHHTSANSQLKSPDNGQQTHEM